ncbi:FBD-associated F-box protein [Rhynchospora pubera]|uniref:FBD-associated F-box protein n=1 Tax=Rhynchospora pubera TaxID=906938 RepID=A0AAV8F896_9POAL|nr:FBD-associated F-box protein [Rhynchospora pubera]
MDNSSRLCVQMNGGIDRISGLPDPILTHILSFLPTKEAVHTCLLSKRWKNMWASVPVLNFDLKEFGDGYSDFKLEDYETYIHRGNEFENPYNEYHDPRPLFEWFLHGVLENREPLHLGSLQFRWAPDGGCRQVSLNWLDDIVLLMPRVISVFIWKHPCPDFPDSVFSCTSLENFELVVDNVPKELVSPKSISLPSLKVLHLGGQVLTDDFMKLLFLGCPVLEELELDECMLVVSDISSNVLKKLVINSFNFNYDDKIQISCPGLLYLDVCSLGPTLFLKNVASLVNAYISLVDCDDFKFLSSLFNVTTLSLTLPFYRIKDLLEKDFPKCQPFTNLKCLEFTFRRISHFRLIVYLLKHSPNLQKLTLYLHELFYIDGKEEDLNQ